jgi:hypothetical protein
MKLPAASGGGIKNHNKAVDDDGCHIDEVRPLAAFF